RNAELPRDRTHGFRPVAGQDLGLQALPLQLCDHRLRTGPQAVVETKCRQGNAVLRQYGAGRRVCAVRPAGPAETIDAAILRLGLQTKSGMLLDARKPQRRSGSRSGQGAALRMAGM